MTMKTRLKSALLKYILKNVCRVVFVLNPVLLIWSFLDIPELADYFLHLPSFKSKNKSTEK